MPADNSRRAIVVDPAGVEERSGSPYPGGLGPQVGLRVRQALGDAGGLTQFGVNLVRLPPGGWSSLRHWHKHEDEFVYVLDGELTLVTDQGETPLPAGKAACFPADCGDGHQLVNRGKVAATYIEVGTRSPVEEVTYPDADLHLRRGPEGRVWANKKGTPY
ncbi:MAG: cupin domain-containing protein [Rhodospirillales bacterium]